MDQLSLGVMARSLKENEHRLPLHPRHVDRIPEAAAAGHLPRARLRRAVRRAPTTSSSAFVGGFRTREQLVAECDVILRPNRCSATSAALRDGQVLWGWPHCVQDAELTQVAIDRQLTLIAFEAMNHWNKDGSFNLHVFHKNNELAGYCSVLHALQLAGITGDYGRTAARSSSASAPRPEAPSPPSTRSGVDDVDVLTHRQRAAVASPIHSARSCTSTPTTPRPRVSHA